MSAPANHVRRLPTKVVEKVWGRTTLPAPFHNPGDDPVGEIWFEPPEEMPRLLVKYLFTSEKLSVQVHPSDETVREGEAGKAECWFVLEAEPDAKLAIGFDREYEPAVIEAAARDGSIEQMLTWHEAREGDVFYLPPGTVHAIGPGLALVEVQQTSETTFRMYDYGRPRELHLDRAMEVADTGPYPARHKGSMESRGETLVDGEHFRLDRIEGAPDAAMCKAYDRPLLALPLSGTVRAAGNRSGEDAEVLAAAGECLFADRLQSLAFEPGGITLLTRTS